MQLCCSDWLDAEVAVSPPPTPIAPRLRALLGAASVVAVGLVLVGNLGALAHLGLVAHAPGPDGMVHVDCAVTAPPVTDSGLGSAGDGHGHEGCHLSQAERPALRLALPAAVRITREAPVLATQRLAPRQPPRAARALFRLAPKQSPPA